MLSKRTLHARDGITIEEVACRGSLGRGGASESTTRHALVLVRRGCFLRSGEGGQSLLDPTVAYCVNPGQEERYDHPHTGGDDCTMLTLEPALAAAIWGGDDTLPTRPLPTSPQLDLRHRLLLACARRNADSHELTERAITIAAHALSHSDRSRVASGRPATIRARRVLVDGARELLAAEPGWSLPRLAHALAVSPHHLSRIFHATTGQTISRYRMRLRARGALERLSDGERDLARLAADLGLADQSHLHRLLRAETGLTPSTLRQALTQPRC